jgi:cytochrome c oxidase subunit 2
VVPGITTRLIFEPTRTGTFQVICAELCGVGHGVMRSRLIVMEPAAYDAWLEDARRQVARQARPAPATTSPPEQPAAPAEQP